MEISDVLLAVLGGMFGILAAVGSVFFNRMIHRLVDHESRITRIESMRISEQRHREEQRNNQGE